MEEMRKWGCAPYGVAVIHGGPGAPGEVAPVARRLARLRGVVEPLQSAATVDGQVEELRAVLERHAALPVALVGHSWGAWLSLLLAARYPGAVDRLILVSSGPFTEGYADGIMRTRLSRMNAAGRAEAERLQTVLDDPAASGRDAALRRFGDLCARADAFAPLPPEPGAVACDASVFAGVWREAAELRRSGRLIAACRSVRCPVTALHGDSDPHPADGVRVPLASAVADFRFVLLERCGHTPWLERFAKERFYEILGEELGNGSPPRDGGTLSGS